MILSKNLLPYILTVFIISSCSTPNEDRKENIDEPQDSSSNDTIEEQITSPPTLFHDIYNSAGTLESREEMSDILELIGAANRSDESLTLENVKLTTDGYTGYEEICPEDDNGSLKFIIGTNSEDLSEYYDFYEPVMEHQSQDLFIYAIEEIFVDPEAERLTATIRYAYFSSESGSYYTDMADPTLNIEIWKNVEFGTMAFFNNRYYMEINAAKLIPKANCDDYEH